MWMVTDLRTEPRSFSLSSSGQGEHRDLALLADATPLANMLGRVEWDRDPVQVELCTCCAIAGCSPGGYVAVRRLPGFVVLVASTHAYGPAAGPGARTEYAPPDYLVQLGAPLIPEADWGRLRTVHPDLPAAAEVAPLNWAEIVVLAQLEAPGRLLGEPGCAPREPLSRAVLAAEPPLSARELDRLGDLRSWAIRDDASVVLRPAADVRAYSMVFDGSFDGVVLFGEGPEGPGLYLAPGLVVFPDR